MANNDIQQVKETVQSKIKIKEKKYKVDVYKRQFDALCINDNTDRFIQERGALLSSAISKKEQGYIRIEETQTNEDVYKRQSINRTQKNRQKYCCILKHLKHLINLDTI